MALARPPVERGRAALSRRTPMRTSSKLAILAVSSIALALVAAPAAAGADHANDASAVGREDKDDDKPVCKATFRSVTVESTEKNSLKYQSFCKFAIHKELGAKLCTVAFSGNKNPEKFDVTYTFGKTDYPLSVGCPGKK
jgi:hypothetical protein